MRLDFLALLRKVLHRSLHCSFRVEFRFRIQYMLGILPLLLKDLYETVLYLINILLLKTLLPSVRSYLPYPLRQHQTKYFLF